MTLLWKQRPARADMTARSAATNDNTTTCGGGRELYWRWQVLTACISTRRPPGVDRSGEPERERAKLLVMNEWMNENLATWSTYNHNIHNSQWAGRPGGPGRWVMDRYVCYRCAHKQSWLLLDKYRATNQHNKQPVKTHIHTSVTPGYRQELLSAAETPPSPHLQCPD